jgi:hypothetical protein
LGWDGDNDSAQVQPSAFGRQPSALGPLPNQFFVPLALLIFSSLISLLFLLVCDFFQPFFV